MDAIVNGHPRGGIVFKCDHGDEQTRIVTYDPCHPDLEGAV